MSTAEPPTKKAKTSSLSIVASDEEGEGFGNETEQAPSLSIPEMQAKLKDALANGPDSDFHEAIDLLDEFEDAEKPDILSSIATIENTEAMLTKWGSDPVNDPTSFKGIEILKELPKEIVAHHAEAMLQHIDSDVCEGEKYGFHETYHYLWENCVAGVVQHCPDKLNTYIQETMIPRLQSGKGEDKPDKEGDGDSDVCEDPRLQNGKSEGEPDKEGDDDSDVCEDQDEEDEAKPSIDQDSELYLEAVRLGVIAEESPELLSRHSDEVKKSLSEHWIGIMGAKGQLHASALEALAKAVKFD